MGQSGLWMEEPQEASPCEGGPDCSPRLGCGRTQEGCACRLQDAGGLPCERRRGEKCERIRKRSRGVEREWPRAQMCRLVLQKLLRPPASPL